MAAIRPTEMIASKWSRVAGQSGPSYEEGVSNPLRDFAAGATAANDAWKAGVQAAVQANRFTAGVRRTGNEKWQRNAKAKGPARFQQGVALAQGDYAAGFAPYAETIKSAQLPPRGPRRSPQNLQRVAAIVQALSTRKEALSRGA